MGEKKKEGAREGGGGGGEKEERKRVRQTDKLIDREMDTELKRVEIRPSYQQY